MTWWHGLVLGLLQGVTEFLPVSSSGHLALAQMVIPGFHQPGVLFDAVLHVGTAAAVVWHERSNLARWATTAEGWRLLLLLLIGTVATAAVAFPLRALAVGTFTRVVWIGAFLLVTGAVVLGTRFLAGGTAAEGSTRWRQALIVGLAQGCAIFPGLSRSGMTIAASLGSGLDRRWAARFSFLLSIPAIAGVTLAELVGARGELALEGGSFWAICALGLVAAAVSGYLALRVVIVTVSSRSFHRFAWYCLVLGAVVVLIGAGGQG